MGTAGGKRAEIPYVLLVFLAALVVRVCAVALVPRALSNDIDLYRQLAESVVTKGSFSLGGKPTAFRPPLYPLLLVPCVALGDAAWWAMAGLHVALGLVAVLAVYAVGCRLGGRAVGTIAGLLVAGDPLLVWQSTQLMSETACVTMVALAIAAGVRACCGGLKRASFLAGVFAGLAALCRANLLPWAVWVPVVIGWVHLRWATGSLSIRGKNSDLAAGAGAPRSGSAPSRHLRGNRGNLREGITTALLVSCGVAIVLLPWGIRNRLVLGRWIFGTTHGGVTFLLANNDDFYDHIAEGNSPGSWQADRFQRWWTDQVASSGLQGEAQIEALAYRMAWNTIWRRPGEFARASLFRVGWLWSPLPEGGLGRGFPHWTTIRWMISGYYLALYAVAGLGLWQLCRRAKGEMSACTVILLGVGLIAVLTGVHALYWSNIRMRAPAMPFVCLMGALGALEIAKGQASFFARRLRAK